MKNTNMKKKTRKYDNNKNINTINSNKLNRNNKYNDFELNSLKYQMAVKIDKRTFIEFYISLIKRRQIFIFTFFINNDYNSRCIKISLFLIALSLDYAVNTLFYNDTTMHKLYIDEGQYNFIYRIPNILYTTLISNIISGILEYLSLSEDDIIEIKNNNKDNCKIIKIKKCMKIKLTIFFILNFNFLLLFWYYISCFGVVYTNTQIHVIKDTFYSFGMSLLNPFGLCLVPGIFRIPSLRASKKNKECLYKFSQFLEKIMFLFF